MMCWNRKVVKAKDIPAGHIFKYADAPGDGLATHCQFLKLSNQDYNVVNIANMTAASVDPDTDVIDIGTFARDTRVKPASQYSRFAS